MKQRPRTLVLLLVLAVTLFVYNFVQRRRDEGGSTAADLEEIARRRAAVWGPRFDEPGFERMKPPVLGEWLHRFPETGQTFDEYVKGAVNKRTAARQTIYFQPLAPIGTRSRAALAAVATFTRAFFQVEVRVLPDVPIHPDTLVPNRRGGGDQHDADAILRHLKKSVPEDALIYAAIADRDLFSGELNFVFGLGSLGERVGAYSFVRFGEDAAGRTEKVYRRRAFQLVAHELGHILTLQHCIYYLCEQNGSLSLWESDRAPVHACNVCLAKLEWNLGFDRKARYRDLAAVFRAEGLDDEARFCEERAR